MPISPSNTIDAATARQRRRLILAASTLVFWPLAPVATAQSAIQSIANQNPLPLRNIQIEVRQVHSRSREEAGVRLDTRPHLDQQQEQLAGTTTQLALVLNGRDTRIALRSSRPFRLMQTQFRNGRPVLVPGVVLLEASTGFMATPRWDGSDQVELELTATGPASSNATALVLPLGEWVSVAQSESGSQSSRSGLLGQSSESEQSSSELQVRLTVR